MKTQFEISRELAERLAVPRNTSDGYITHANAVIELRALLAAPVVEREPVAIISGGWSLLWYGGETLVETIKRTGLKTGDKLYLHPGKSPAPALVLPERKRADPHDESQSTDEYHVEVGFNECLDELQELNQ